MKTLKDIILEATSEVNPLPRRTKNFIAKHAVQKIDYPVDAENQFTAKSISKDKTKGASYHNGEDAVVYEEAEVSEASMSDTEMKKREDIVKGMKKNAQSFKDRYGDRWKSVMYATATKAAMKEGMDPVGKEDSDINNDGKVNASDKYLHRRRKAIAANVKEEIEQIDEISQDTIHSYYYKAAADRKKAKAEVEKGMSAKSFTPASVQKTTDSYKRFIKRGKGMTAAANKMSEQIDEAFRAGSIKLHDGSSVTLTKESADVLNNLFNQLNSSNKVKMEDRLMSGSKGFDEILAFAKEV